MDTNPISGALGGDTISIIEKNLPAALEKYL